MLINKTLDIGENVAVFVENEPVLTYGAVFEASNTIKALITKNISGEMLCVGLQMHHNIYIPSIVISLQDLGLSFMFLARNDTNLLTKLGITYVLTFTEPHTSFDSIELKDQTLYLYTTGNNSGEYKDICYIIATSGTTGAQKSVRVSHTSIESNIKCLSRIFKVTSRDIIHWGTPLTFDPSMIELGLALYNGASLSMSRDVQATVTILQIVPSVLLSYGGLVAKLLTGSLRVLALGGEEFPIEVLNHPRSDRLRIFNLYGITELSCWGAVAEVNSEDVTLGRALDDTELKVYDEDGCEISDGPGEIHLGSATRVCLLDNEEAPPKLRATGDLALVKSGKVYYAGRKNDTFKRFGHKLHLSTIEMSVTGIVHLKCCAVFLREKSKLLLFFVLGDCASKVKTLDKIRVKLLHGLPPEHFPDYLDIIPELPLGRHGKIDRRALTRLYLNQEHSVRTKADKFKSSLHKYLGVNIDNHLERTFFELGGTSILALQVLTELGDSSLKRPLFETSLASCIDILTGNDGAPTQKRLKLRFQLQKRWSSDLKACVDSSPLCFTCDGRDLVAVGGFSHIFRVIDARTGGCVTEYVLPDVIESTPVQSLCEMYLYIGCFDGVMYCLTIMEAVILWGYQTRDRIKAPPVLTEDGGLIFGSYDKSLHCLNAKTGELRWETPLEGAIATPTVIHQHRAYISTITGLCYCVSAINGEILWKYIAQAPIFGGVSLMNRSLIFPSLHGVLCLSLDGDHKWSYKLPGLLFASLCLHESTLILGSHNYNLYRIEATDAGVIPENVTGTNLGGKISTVPCLWRLNNEQFIAVCVDDGEIFLLDFGGLIVGKLRLPGEVFSAVVVHGTRVFVGCRDNNLYCFDII